MSKLNFCRRVITLHQKWTYYWTILSTRGRYNSRVQQQKHNLSSLFNFGGHKSELARFSELKTCRFVSNYRFCSAGFHWTTLCRREIQATSKMPKIKRKSDTKIEELSAEEAKGGKKAEKPAKRPKSDTKIEELSAEEAKGDKKAEKPAKKPKLEKKISDSEDAIKALDVPEIYTTQKKSQEGNAENLKIASWNVAGLKAWLKKDGISYIKKEEPDILFLMETKIAEENIPKETEVEGYHTYWYEATAKKGYSGTGLYSKKEPISVTNGIGDEEHDNEGRVITAEYDDFYFVGCYVPNSGRGLSRLAYRQEWDVVFTEYLANLDKKKPVIYCGDLNVAHQEIDLKNPKSNRNKTPGFSDEEREGFTALLEKGFVDSFRHLYPEREYGYSFWTYMGNARAKNVGWRLDYFVISERLVPKLCDTGMRTWIMGSDHCPIALHMSM